MSTFEYLSMRCDECGKASYINCPNHTILNKRMVSEGWYVDGFQDLCPECRPQVEEENQQPRNEAHSTQEGE